MSGEEETRRLDAATERLLMSHPSWFKRLSYMRNRGSDEARYAARTLVEAVLRAADEVAPPVQVTSYSDSSVLIRVTTDEGRRFTIFVPAAGLSATVTELGRGQLMPSFLDPMAGGSGD